VTLALNRGCELAVRNRRVRMAPPPDTVTRACRKLSADRCRRNVYRSERL